MRVVQPERAQEITHILFASVSEIVYKTKSRGNYTLEEIQERLNNRIRDLSECEILAIQPLKPGWKNSSFGSHCVRVTEVLGLSIYSFSATLINTACMNDFVALNESELFQGMVLQTAWENL